MQNFSSFLFLVFLIISASSLQERLNFDQQKDIKIELNIDHGILETAQKKPEPKPFVFQQNSEGQTLINMDFKIEGELEAKKIVTDKLEYSGELKLPEMAISQLNVENVQTNQLKVDTIMAKDKNIVINGNIVLTNEISGDNINLRGGDGTWSLVNHDDFETQQSLEGWSDKRVNHCKDDPNTHLGGHCNFAGNKVTKTFNNLPPHSIVRINALYHMIDYWQGEEGYMLVDGEKKWSKRGVSKENGIDLCGGKSNDPEFNINIDIIVEHTEDSIEIAFGSTLTGDPCLHSFAVDDVMIYTKL